MATYNMKKIGVLLVSIFFLTTVFYNPSTSPKVEAGLPVIDIPQWATELLDRAAQMVAKRLTDDLVKSTIRWANSGFDGNPAYVTDPEGFLRSNVSRGVGDAINDSRLGFLCSPFQAQIKLSLVKQYVADEPYSCTIEQIGGNFENFVNNFDEGGWDAWFAVTQSETGNPYGAFLKAKLDTDRRITNLIGLKKDELQMNSGFLNKTVCDGLINPVVPTRDMIDYENGNITPQIQDLLDQGWDPNKAAGECLGRTRVVTPGDTVKEALDGTLLSGVNRLIDVDSFNQLVGAFATGLLDRYVLGDRGLFGSRFNDHFSASSDTARIPTPKFGWVPCAREGQMCIFDGQERVKMGYSRVAQKILDDVDGEVSCDRDTFDFPAKGSGGSVTKQSFVNRDQECYYYGQIAGPYNLTADDENWIDCAEQGGFCTFEGNRLVRYGAGFLYYIKLANGGISCANSAFGGNPTQFSDPNQAKSCAYKVASTSDATIPPTQDPAGDTGNIPILICLTISTDARVGTPVVWSAGSTLPEGTLYQWRGDEVPTSDPGPLQESISINYTTPGQKFVSILSMAPRGEQTETPCGSVTVSP